MINNIFINREILLLWIKRGSFNPSFLLWSLHSRDNLWVSLVWLHTIAVQWLLLLSSFHPDGLFFRTWRSCMTEVELHVGTCGGIKATGTTFVALPSCIAASHFESKHIVFKAERRFPVVFPCRETTTIVRDELLRIFWCVSPCLSMQTVKISNRSSNLGRYGNYKLFWEFALGTIRLTCKYIHFPVNFASFWALYFIAREHFLGLGSLHHFLKYIAVNTWRLESIHFWSKTKNKTWGSFVIFLSDTSHIICLSYWFSKDGFCFA